MSLCNNSSDNKSYWIHRVDVKVSPQVTTVTYMHQSQPSLHSLLINFTVHLQLWPGDHVIWCNATINCKQTVPAFRWHWSISGDCQVRVGGAPWNCYGVNVTKAVIGAYMWQWWLVQILWHLPCVFSSFCCLMNYYTVTFATRWYMGWVKILQLTVEIYFCPFSCL